jgi:hypothetical protein
LASKRAFAAKPPENAATEKLTQRPAISSSLMWWESVAGLTPVQSRTAQQVSASGRLRDFVAAPLA